MAVMKRGQSLISLEDRGDSMQLPLIARLEEAIDSISSQTSYSEIGRELTKQLAVLFAVEHVAAYQWLVDQSEFILQAEYPQPNGESPRPGAFPAHPELVEILKRNVPVQVSAEFLKKTAQDPFLGRWTTGCLLVMPIVLPRGSRGFILVF